MWDVLVQIVQHSSHACRTCDAWLAICSTIEWYLHAAGELMPDQPSKLNSIRLPTWLKNYWKNIFPWSDLDLICTHAWSAWLRNTAPPRPIRVSNTYQYAYWLKEQAQDRHLNFRVGKGVHLNVYMYWWWWSWDQKPSCPRPARHQLEPCIGISEAVLSCIPLVM